MKSGADEAGAAKPRSLCTMKLCFGGAVTRKDGKKVCPLRQAEEVGADLSSPSTPSSSAAPPTSCIVRSFSESTSLIRHCAATAAVIRDSLRKNAPPPPPPQPPPQQQSSSPQQPPSPAARSTPLPPLPPLPNGALSPTSPTGPHPAKGRLRSSFSIAERVKDGTLVSSPLAIQAHGPLRASFSPGSLGNRARIPHISVASALLPGPIAADHPASPSSSSSASLRGSPRSANPAASAAASCAPASRQFVLGTSAPPLPPKQRKPQAKMPDPAAPLPSAPSPDPGGSGGLSISELREIAARQQQQVESQQKMLRQREERLRQLRSQEEQQRQFVRANPQLHQLREQVEQQELQLRRLRTLRGQMEQFQTNNENLASELSMIQSLCNEKERDLAACIRKVNHLAAQMTDLNRMKQQQQQTGFPGPANNGGGPAASDPLPPSQLDQIRRELQHRYPVPLGAKLSEQSHQLQARQSEAEHLDRRLGELRARLRERRTGPEPPVPLNGEPVAAFLQRQADAASSTGSSSNSSLFSAPLPGASPSSSSAGGGGGSGGGSTQSNRPCGHQPRYASRSVIQDTYTRRLAGPNLERYKSKAHEIYRANLSQLNVDKLSSRTNTPRQLIQQHHKRHSTAERDEEETPTPPPLPAVAAASSPATPTSVTPTPPVTTADTATETPSVGDSGTEESSSSSQVEPGGPPTPQVVGEGDEPVSLLVSPSKKSCLKSAESSRSPLTVTFEPLYLLLDGSLEGEMKVVREAAHQIDDVSACTEEGITALHTAICATQAEVVEFLIKVGANVNAMDADGWTPLHCAASCNNLDFVRMLVEHGAAIFLRTNSDLETALEKCEGEEDTGCAECLYNYQERLGSANAGLVYAVYSYEAANEDELSFRANDELTVLRKGDATEKEWYWARDSQGRDGYVPRNFLALTPAVQRRVRSSPFRSGPRIASDHSDQTAL